MEDEVVVLSSPSLLLRTISVDVKRLRRRKRVGSEVAAVVSKELNNE